MSGRLEHELEYHHTDGAFGDGSFAYQGIVLWNSLSLNMKMAPSLSSFKKLYLDEQFSTLWPEELNV